MEIVWSHSALSAINIVMYATIVAIHAQPMVRMIDSSMIQERFELCVKLSPLYHPTNQTCVEVL